MVLVMSERSAVIILAAGLGTRMNSDTAKVLHEVAGRPLIIWAVEAALDGGADTVVAVLGYQHERVTKTLESRYGVDKIRVALQTEQKGTGDAASCGVSALRDLSDDAIGVIVSGDAPLLLSERVTELIQACGESTAGMSLLSTFPGEPTQMGRLVRDARGELLKIVEHRDATTEERAISEVNAGFYALNLGHLRSGLEGLQPNNAQGELYLTDLVTLAAQRGQIRVIEAPFAEVHGINDRLDLAAVDAHARRRINQRHMRAGATMPAPDQVFIDADVGPIGRDVWIGPNVRLSGNTRIDDQVRIDIGCVLENVTVAQGTFVKPYSVLTDSDIGPNAQIGPFTHCRPGTQVDDGAKLGNFVETKKTRMMAGAKANHHAYLGDTSVGAKANIGAGTITCNYDGFDKHKTVIEAGAFIGSDTQLVAPVTVGRGAFVGAGSTVTKDVPRAALALSRVKQVNVDGWADRFRKKKE